MQKRNSAGIMRFALSTLFTSLLRCTHTCFAVSQQFWISLHTGATDERHTRFCGNCDVYMINCVPHSQHKKRRFVSESWGIVSRPVYLTVGYDHLSDYYVCQSERELRGSRGGKGALGQAFTRIAHLDLSYDFCSRINHRWNASWYINNIYSDPALLCDGYEKISILYFFLWPQ